MPLYNKRARTARLAATTVLWVLLTGLAFWLVWHPGVPLIVRALLFAVGCVCIPTIPAAMNYLIRSDPHWVRVARITAGPWGEPDYEAHHPGGTRWEPQAWHTERPEPIPVQVTVLPEKESSHV